MDKNNALAKTEKEMVASSQPVGLPTENAKRKYINLAKKTQKVLIDSWSTDPEIQQGIAAYLEDQRSQLAGPNASPLERLVIDRVVLSGMQANMADMLMGEVVWNFSKEIREHFQCFQDRSTRRHLLACKILAQIQRLLGPSVQINVAERQINVVNAGQAAEGGR